MPPLNLFEDSFYFFAKVCVVYSPRCRVRRVARRDAPQQTGATGRNGSAVAVTARYEVLLLRPSWQMAWRAD